MAKPFGKISAAVPLGAFGIVVVEPSVAEEQNFPPRHHGTEIEWKGQFVGGSVISNGRLVHQKRVKRSDVIIRCLCKMIVGKRRIELTAFAINTVLHRAPECGF